MKYKNAKVQDLSPKLIEILKKNTEVVELQEQYSNDKYKKLLFKKGLFLYGITGSGKTHALYAVYNSYLKGRSSGVETWVEILAEIKDRISSNGSTKYVIDNITEREVVFLDDVGAEKQSEFMQETLYLIIDRCYRYERTLFISTNLSLEEFSQRYGDRLLSRIYEMCEVHEMEAIDRRLT